MILKAWAQGMVDAKTEEMAKEVSKILRDQGFLPADEVIIDDDDEIDTDALVEQLRQHADDKILTFDCECIENEDDYAGLFNSFVQHAGLADRFGDVASTFDYEAEHASLRVVADGKRFKAQWEQNSDWVAQPFFDFVDEVFGQQFDKRFTLLPAQDQCAELIVLDKEHGETVAECFQRLSGKVDPDELSGNHILLTILVSVVAFAITLVTGLIAGSFWMTFGLGIAFWGAFALWRAIRIINRQQTEENLQKQLQENPELIGQMALDYINSMKKA